MYKYFSNLYRCCYEEKDISFKILNTLWLLLIIEFLDYRYRGEIKARGDISNYSLLLFYFKTLIDLLFPNILERRKSKE